MRGRALIVFEYFRY